MNLLLGGAHLSCYQAIIVSGCVNLSTEMDVCFVVAYSNKVQQKLWISLAGDFSYLMFSERSGVTEVFFLVFRSTPIHGGIKRNFLYSPVARVFDRPCSPKLQRWGFLSSPSFSTREWQPVSTLHRWRIAGPCLLLPSYGRPLVNMSSDPGHKWISHPSLGCCSVAQSCPTLCNPMDCSTPGLTVLHCLSEFAQTHVLWVSDAIQPSRPLLPLLLLPSILYLPWYRWALSSISAGLGQYIFYTYPTNLSKRTWIQVFGQLSCPSPAWDTFCILWQKFWDTDRFCACLPSPACLHHWQALSGFLPHS